MSNSQIHLSTTREGSLLPANTISNLQSLILTSVRGAESVSQVKTEKVETDEDEVDGDKKPEPTVSSPDPEDRKRARRLRILRRNEAIRKATYSAERVQVDEEGSIKTPLESQVEDSAKELERLLLEGRELVTNVRVANDSREVARWLDEAEKRESRTKRLEEDAETTKKMYEEVEKKWKELSSSSDPMDLKAEIDAQKEKCDLLLARKDEIIKQLIAEVDEADIRFVRDQSKQKRDIAILVDRIENHVKLMKQAYRNELQLIEDAISSEKKELVDSATESWGKLYEERERQETENLSKRFNDIEDQENEIQKLRTEHREKYRKTKIRLETDLQTMQKEMEQIKFQCFLNSEKLDYNYQILQKREEENIVIRAQQKRRLNKLQDTLTNLRRRIRLGKQAANNEAARLNDEVVRLHDNILDTERKADCFANINDRKYHKVWDMNEATARKLLDRIYTIDKIIHEQQLGYEWEEPSAKVSCKTDMPSFRSAMQAVSELFHESEEGLGELYGGTESEKSLEKCSTSERDADGVQGKLVRRRLLKHLLQRIADASGFLVESRLSKLLEPYSKCQRTIVLLDNVFDALGLRFEADIELLKEYFLPYAVCTECPPQDTKDSDYAPGGLVEGRIQSSATVPRPRQCDEPDELAEMPPPRPKFSFDSEEVSGTCPSAKDYHVLKPEDDAAPSEAGSEPPSGGRAASAPPPMPFTRQEPPPRADSAPPGIRSQAPLPRVVVCECVPITSVSQQTTDYAEESVPLLPKCPVPPAKACIESHKLEMDPIYIYMALNDFVTKFHSNELSDIKSIARILSRKRHTISRMLSPEDVTNFWEGYRAGFPEERQRLWSGFLKGLNKYHQILSQRHKLNMEAMALKRQNEELQQLLANYVDYNEKMKHKNGTTLPPLHIR